MDPTQLPPGLHYTEINAFDTENVDKGPIFRIPVTVTKPTPLIENKLSVSASYQGGKIYRHFVEVPNGATWAGKNVNFIEIS